MRPIAFRPSVPASHLLVIPLRPGEAALPRDALAHELGDDHELTEDVAHVVERRVATAVRPRVREPSGGRGRLPRTVPFD